MRDKSWIWSILVAGGHFWVDFYTNMLPAILPFIGVIWGLSNSQLAFVVAVQSMTANFLQPVLGYFIDKSSREWSLGLVIAFTAVPMCFIYLAGEYYLFLLIVSIVGFGSALYHPLGASRAVIGGSVKDKALKMSVFSSMGSLGYAIAPAVTAYIVSKWGLQGLLNTLAPALVWILLLRINRDMKEYVVEERTTARIAQEKVNIKQEKFEALRPLLLLSSIVALRSWLATAVTVFVPLWLVAGGAAESLAGLNLTFFLIAGTAGGFIYGYIYPKIGAGRILITSYVLSIVFLPLYLFLPEQYKLPALIVLGFNLMGTLPVTVVIGQELLPNRTGLASGLTMGLAFGVGGVGTAITGILADAIGVTSALLINSLVLIPASIMVVMLQRERNRYLHREHTMEGGM